MKNAILGLCLLATSGSAVAQSYHFSQFFSTPLLTNPANTGFTDGPYRVASNIRRQGGGANPFFTGYVSAELSPLRDQLALGHKAGIGVYLMNDRGLGSAVQTNSAGLSLAYHVGLDPYGEQSIGVGVQASYHQRRIDYSKLTFENQFGANGYDPGLPIGEPLDAKSKGFFDVNAGVLYNRMVGNNAYFAGLSVYNILRHKENFLPEDFTMPTRIAFQAGSQLAVDYNKLYVSLTTMRQAGATETTLGAAYGYVLTEEERNELLLGAWYRLKDALIPYVGFQRSNFSLGLSYDVTLSDLQLGGQTRSAFELTFIFRSAEKHELKTTVPWY